MASKRKLGEEKAEDEDPVDPSDELLFLALGGGNEVGRSCHIIQYRGKTVMLDAGIHPAYDGLAALPFYDEFDLSTVDVLLITHFHMDHAASLPYVLAKTNFKGRVYMTHPTKAIYKWLMQDSIRVQNTHTSSESITPLFTEQDVTSTLPLIQTIAFHATHTYSSIRITPYPAGHVLGAAMYLISIAGLNILFTGDYSRETDRHLIPASVPKGVKIDVLITESTFGVASHVPRLEREAALMKSVTGILNRGGRVLMPVFAIGRAQELLLILEDYWTRHSEYQKYPIYYASNLAKKCMVVYQTYIDAMNDNIRGAFQRRLAEAADGSGSGGGPWDFRFIRSLKSLERFEDLGGCVMLASPGMMQNGVSRALLERWAPDPKNGVLITGYSVEGTMAKLIVTEPETIQANMTARQSGVRGLTKNSDQKVMIPRRCTVQEISFAAHVDGTENREFVEEVAAPVVILVHGEKTAMMRFKSKLLSLNVNKAVPVKVFSPANCEELRIPFRRDKVAKIVGQLANRVPNPATTIRPGFTSIANDDDGNEEKKPRLDAAEEDQILTGVLVQNDFKLSLMAPEDLKEYAGLTTTVIRCRQRLTLSAAGPDLIKWALEGTFGTVKVSGVSTANGTSPKVENENGQAAHDDHVTFGVMGAVDVVLKDQGEVVVEWEGNVHNDSIADAVLAVLMSVETSPAAVKQSSRQNSHSHSHNHDHGHEQPSGRRNLHANVTPAERLSRLCMFLESHFGADAVSPIPAPRLAHNQDVDQVSREKAEAAELARLHGLGIPVAGLQIRLDDKLSAKVWLETLEVECGTRSFKDRVQAVVERAVETVRPLWE